MVLTSVLHVKGELCPICRIENNEKEKTMYELDNNNKCPKCGCSTGDSWAQCENKCPMNMSPYYSEEVAKQYGSSQLLTEVLPNNKATINEET